MILLLPLSGWANDLKIINSGYEGVSVKLYQNEQYMGTYFVGAHSSIYIDIGSAGCFNYSYSTENRARSSFYACTARIW